MNTENLEKEFERVELSGFRTVEPPKHNVARDGHLKWSIMILKGVDSKINKEIVLTLWNSNTAQQLIVDYVITDTPNDSCERHNKEFNLADFEDDWWYDVQCEIETWVEACDKARHGNVTNGLLGNEHDDAGRELKVGNLYSETDAVVTAKMMNDYGLSFVTTLEDENPDLRRNPPFSANDIVGWFDESIRIIQKRHYERNVDCETQYISEYANGPIYITATCDGIVCLSVNLVSHTGA